jgi:hypothetical protein
MPGWHPTRRVLSEILIDLPEIGATDIDCACVVSHWLILLVLEIGPNRRQEVIDGGLDARGIGKL